jgi:pyridoxine 5-phosphate synthase
MLSFVCQSSKIVANLCIFDAPKLLLFMTKLSVNINKIATLRNARGGNVPNIVRFAIDCERFGADGITVHPRPDERHITLKDVYELNEVISTEFNIEGFPDDRYLKIIEEIRPAQATLVPDPPHVLTSNAGWDTIRHFDKLKNLVAQFKQWGVRSSIFIEPNLAFIEQAQALGVDRIELYTGSYAEGFDLSPEEAVKPYVEAAKLAEKIGLGVNAGHDLSLSNLHFFKQALPKLDEVSIGHALISDALYLGIENTIQRYLFLLGS